MKLWMALPIGLYLLSAVAPVGPQHLLAQVAEAPAPPATLAAVVAAPGAPVATHAKGKKDVYTGPDTVVELPPTPMLDEEGKQRLDPDGKPMFNPPVRQQRDKHGHPLFDEAGKPVMQTATERGYDEHGKKLHAEKVKAPKMTPVSISRGVYSVDGMTAKAALNYDIADFKYLYLFAPGVGIAVVSNEPFPGATAQQRAFDGKVLTVRLGEHLLQIASDKPFLGKDARPAYVLLDRVFTLPSPAPVVGYGSSHAAPYAWPGARPNDQLAGVAAPPVPTSMLPVQLLQPCPSGQMRPPAPRALPGQTAQVMPCVPISTLAAAKASTATPPAR
jgi:hypothetical protein